jgi:hypothetical protein
VQHFGAERLPLHVAGHQVIEQRCNRARLFRAAHPPDAAVVMGNREAGGAEILPALAMQQAPVGVFYRHGRAQRSLHDGHERSRLALPAHELSEHHRHGASPLKP